jgi:hypothetical protein
MAQAGNHKPEIKKNSLVFPFQSCHNHRMKIEIHIDNIEIQDIIDTLKDQGVDVTSAEVQSHIEDYIQGAIHDSRHERMDCIVDSLLDLQD